MGLLFYRFWLRRTANKWRLYLHKIVFTDGHTAAPYNFLSKPFAIKWPVIVDDLNGK